MSVAWVRWVQKQESGRGTKVEKAASGQKAWRKSKSKKKKNYFLPQGTIQRSVRCLWFREKIPQKEYAPVLPTTAATEVVSWREALLRKSSLNCFKF